MTLLDNDIAMLFCGQNNNCNTYENYVDMNLEVFDSIMRKKDFTGCWSGSKTLLILQYISNIA